MNYVGKGRLLRALYTIIHFGTFILSAMGKPVLKRELALSGWFYSL